MSYPVPSAPKTCAPGQNPSVQRRHWRFGQVDPASERRHEGRGRITAWCVACGELLEVQEEGTGRVLFSGFPHTIGPRLSPFNIERFPTYAVSMAAEELIEEALRRGHVVQVGRHESGDPLWDLTPSGAEHLLDDDDRERWARARGLPT